MSTVPADIAGIGSTAQKPRVTPGFDALRAGLGPEEYFVLSRVDGLQSVRDVLLATGLSVERGIAIITRLRWIGALLLPGETEPPAPATRPPEVTGPALKPTAPRTITSTTRPPPTGSVTAPPLTRVVMARQPTSNPSAAGHATVAVPRAATAPVSPQAQPPAPPPEDRDRSYDLTNPSSEELAALAENVDISPEDRRRVLALRRLVDKHDPHMLLGVSQGADARQLKRAYFRLSKDIHPDRYYGKKLGSFADRFALVFESVSRAYAFLTATPDSSRNATTNQAFQQPQTPTEYAAELFERACALEVGGDALEAMKHFAAAVRIDPQLRYLRRAATCALAAGQPKTALEYAKKAQALTPTDPSSARLLATAFRANGKLSDAEDLLVMAMAMKSENDSLGNELRHDLADVRRLLNG